MKLCVLRFIKNCINKHLISPWGQFDRPISSVSSDKIFDRRCQSLAEVETAHLIGHRPTNSRPGFLNGWFQNCKASQALVENKTCPNAYLKCKFDIQISSAIINKRYSLASAILNSLSVKNEESIQTKILSEASSV